MAVVLNHLLGHLGQHTLGQCRRGCLGSETVWLALGAFYNLILPFLGHSPKTQIYLRDM